MHMHVPDQLMSLPIWHVTAIIMAKLFVFCVLSKYCAFDRIFGPPGPHNFWKMFTQKL